MNVNDEEKTIETRDFSQNSHGMQKHDWQTISEDGDRNITEAISLQDFIERSPLENNAIALQTEDPMVPQIWSQLDETFDETRVDRLRDIAPTDWAFSALQSLIERYDCIAGYPDGTFRGDRVLSRYEFAAGLNACLQRMEILFGETLSELVTREEFEALQRLLAEFEEELAIVSTRVDGLEARLSVLEDNQFSTTVLFGGEAIMTLASGWGGNPPGTGVAEPIFAYTSTLGIVSTFTGRDRFRLSFSAGNYDNLAFAGPDSLNTRTALMSFQSGTSDQIVLDSIEYRTAAFGNRVVLTIKPIGFQLSDVLTVNSAYFDSGKGALSRFAEGTPVFKIGALDAGIGFDWLIGKNSRLQVAYGVRDSNESGWFGAEHSTLGVQLLAQPFPKVVTGFAYINGYARDGRLDTFTGSFNADTSGQFFSSTPVQIHAINGSLQWEVLPKVTLGAWGGLIYSRGLGLDETAAALTKTYLFSLGIADPFGREGDLLAFLGGQPPRLFLGTGPVPEDPSSSFHFEMFYNFKVNDNISITPGFFLVTNPGNISRNNTIYVGAIRTTFRF
ncbi:MAG: carbohydrate porin [Cyanobacteria bacterium SBLK]|nr:carbohydrate porin [Cyanobacteria bacterium SBLK]